MPRSYRAGAGATRNLNEEEEDLNGRLAGAPLATPAWMMGFGYWLAIIGVIFNLFELFTSTGGTIEFAATRLIPGYSLSGVSQGQSLTILFAMPNFPIVAVMGFFFALACQTCMHLLLQPLQSNLIAAQSLAQKRQWSKAAKHMVDWKTGVCLVSIVGNLITDGFFANSLFGNIILVGMIVLVFPFMSTTGFYYGLAGIEKAKQAAEDVLIVREVHNETVREAARKARADYDARTVDSDDYDDEEYVPPTRGGGRSYRRRR